MNRLSQLASAISTLVYGCALMAQPLYHVVVDQSGNGDFTSIQAAINHAPAGDSPYVVYIRNGVYQEKLSIDRHHVYLIGEDRDRTIITATTANGTLDDQGKKFGTSGSRTVLINAHDFKARSLTIENGFDFIENQAKRDDDPSKLHDTQAVALLIAKNADRAQFKNVSLKSYQDTLYLRGGRTVFEQSQISGTIDFIFGHGTGLFINSDIIARNRKDVEHGNSYGYITAPATNIDQPFGLVFKDCRLKKETDVPEKSYALGRPWHPTTTFADGRYADPNAVGHAVFINCEMDDHIYGWDKMSGKDIDQQTIWFYPEDSRFWEFSSRGIGGRVEDKRPQLNKEMRQHYRPTTILSGWQPTLSLGEQSQLAGEVLHRQIQFPALVTIQDSIGQTAVTQTNLQGHYKVSIAGMTPPLLVSVDDQSGESCLYSDQKRSVCLSALVVETQSNQTTRGHVNPFSDLIVSNLAIHEGIDGPALLGQRSVLPAFSYSVWLKANQHFRQQMLGSLESQPDPVSYLPSDHAVMNTLIQQVVHNRGYNTTTGQASSVYLTDLSFRPIIDLSPISQYLSTATSLADRAERIEKASTRLFIVGDSTAAHYEPEVYPRMGWGQVLAERLEEHQTLMVVNAARSGRSSRDFINGRWLDYLEPMVRKGDYLLIQFGHNDAKCNGADISRGAIDVANLCTYPNDQQGQLQAPDGAEEYSFQYSLQRYLTFAQRHQLQAILLTSVPRARDIKNQPGLPINPRQHETRQNKQQGYQYVGSYYQTVLDTAKKEQVPLLDIQQRMITAANEYGDWRSLWLAVDPEHYPYYRERTGSLSKPDTTHFQRQGAEMVVEIVLDEIRRHPKLTLLAEQLQ
ncbi:pectinesterase family protein [Vibrio metschnikovii]|uniref:pectinesterase family protein n=1 Tax=Vibrio metschnikovii TaxID=28172 RepID=UPI001C2F8C0D|nr:pectinesterase family protein [Vibrio metschnikovii]